MLTNQKTVGTFSLSLSLSLVLVVCIIIHFEFNDCAVVHGMMSAAFELVDSEGRGGGEGGCDNKAPGCHAAVREDILDVGEPQV